MDIKAGSWSFWLGYFCFKPIYSQFLQQWEHEVPARITACILNEGAISQPLSTCCNVILSGQSVPPSVHTCVVVKLRPTLCQLHFRSRLRTDQSRTFRIASSYDHIPDCHECVQKNPMAVCTGGQDEEEKRKINYSCLSFFLTKYAAMQHTCTRLHFGAGSLLKSGMRHIVRSRHNNTSKEMKTENEPICFGTQCSS